MSPRSSPKDNLSALHELQRFIENKKETSTATRPRKPTKAELEKLREEIQLEFKDGSAGKGALVACAIMGFLATLALLWFASYYV